MVNKLLPTTMQLDAWIKQRAILQSSDADVLSTQVFERYESALLSAKDKECAQFLKTDFSWQDPTYTKTTSPVIQLPKNAWIASLEQALNLEPKIKNYITEHIRADLHAIEILACAAYTKTRVLYIPDDYVYDQALCIDTVLTDTGTSVELFYIIIGRGSRVIISQSMIDMLVTAGSIKSVYIVVQEGALLTYVIDTHNKHNNTLAYYRYNIHTNAYLKVVSLESNVSAQYIWMDYHLMHEKSQVEHITLSSLVHYNKSALITKQHHYAPYTTSTIIVKALLQEQAHSFYRGTIAIDQKAVHSKAEQQQKALMVSDTAQVCAIPSLEVKTHAVRCSHGSAVGKINKDYLWYLQSRGFDISCAQKFILEGFLQDIIDQHVIKTYMRIGIDRIKNSLVYF